MVNKVPDIGPQTAECDGKPKVSVQGSIRRGLELGAVPVRSSQATGRPITEGKTHAGWFHRSGPSKVQWIPADRGGPANPAIRTDRNQHNITAVASPVPPGPYPVVEVKGRRPAGLNDFLGVTSFTVQRRDLTYLIFGTGEQTADGVRFRQQDLGWDGREMQTWLITTTPDGVVADPGSSA